MRVKKDHVRLKIALTPSEIDRLNSILKNDDVLHWISFDNATGEQLYKKNKK